MPRADREPKRGCAGASEGARFNTGLWPARIAVRIPLKNHRVTCVYTVNSSERVTRGIVFRGSCGKSHRNINGRSDNSTSVFRRPVALELNSQHPSDEVLGVRDIAAWIGILERIAQPVREPVQRPRLPRLRHDGVSAHESAQRRLAQAVAHDSVAVSVALAAAVMTVAPFTCTAHSSHSRGARGVPPGQLGLHGLQGEPLGGQ